MSLSPMEANKVEWQPVIYLKTVFVKTYTFLKLYTKCFLMYKSPMSCKCFKYLIYICGGTSYKCSI